MAASTDIHLGELLVRFPLAVADSEGKYFTAHHVDWQPATAQEDELVVEVCQGESLHRPHEYLQVLQLFNFHFGRRERFAELGHLYRDSLWESIKFVADLDLLFVLEWESLILNTPQGATIWNSFIVNVESLVWLGSIWIAEVGIWCREREPHLDTPHTDSVHQWT